MNQLFFDELSAVLFGTKSATAPYAKSSRTSRSGAEKVKDLISPQCRELEALYREHGGLTDAEAAALLGWERSTVIPRRTTLFRMKRVVHCGERKNPKSGVLNDIYGVA